MTDQQIDEFLEMLAKSPTSARDMVRGLFAAHEAKASPAVPQGWTDADSDAARLALELECLLLDTETLSVVSKWWASANEALELHRQRLATLAAPSQEPVTLADDDIARCINVATCGRPFIGLMNPGGVPSAFSRSLADLLIAALREKEQAT